MVDDEGKFRESIWSINPNWRGLFYGVLSFCGFGVSIFTVWTLCGNETSESWIDIFDAVWNGIVGSVVVVWFLFQVADWTFINIINKFIMAWGDPAREKLRKEGREEGRKEGREEGRKEGRRELEEQARKEAEAFQKRYNEELLKQGVTEEQIRQAYQLSGPSPPSTK